MKKFYNFPIKKILLLKWVFFKNFERPPRAGSLSLRGVFFSLQWVGAALVEVRLLLIAVASRVTEHRLQGTRAQ